jgi:hypothetical protein
MRIIGFDRDGSDWIGMVEGDSVTPVAPLAEFYEDPTAWTPSAVADRRVGTLAMSELTQVPAVPRTA